MTKRLSFVGCAALLLSPIVISAKTAAGDATAELKAACQKMNDAFAKQDLEAFKTLFAEPGWGAWDLDMSGRPGAWATGKDVVKFFDDAFKQAKQMGVTMSWVDKGINCHATGNWGVCLVEGELTTTIPKMPPLTAAFRSTEVLEKQKGGWKIVHHHGSVAKAPPMPPKFMAINAKNAQWVDAGPDMPGVKVSPIWMNPVTMASAMLFKVGATPVKQARHIHPFPATFTVLEGTMTTSGPDGKDTVYGPGTIVYRAAGEQHQTTLMPNSMIYGVLDGPMVTIYVDNMGKPVHASK